MTTNQHKWHGVAQELWKLDAHTKVYEYGGASAMVEGDMVYYVDCKDQRVYARNIGTFSFLIYPLMFIEIEESSPIAITPPNYRYADFQYGNTKRGGIILTYSSECMFDRRSRRPHKPTTNPRNCENKFSELRANYIGKWYVVGSISLWHYVIEFRPRPRFLRRS